MFESIFLILTLLAGVLILTFRAAINRWPKGQAWIILIKMRVLVFYTAGFL